MFGYDDKQQIFVFVNWFSNFLKYFIYSLLALGVYAGSQYFIANKYGTRINYNLLGFQRFGFSKDAYLHQIRFGKYKIKKIPLGVILPLLITFLSSGGLFFTGVISSIFRVNPQYRLGRLYTNLTEFEEAKIALAGPMSNILLAIFIKLLGLNSLDDLMFVSSVTAVSYIIPLPGLDGIKIYFGSKLLYVFSFAFILISAFLLNFLNGLFALILSGMIALIILINYFYKHNQG